jgi:hypothetical protein
MKECQGQLTSDKDNEHPFRKKQPSAKLGENEKRKQTRKCACPCGCQREPDGLEDLCHYCLEVHEDLRKEFVRAKK